MNLKECFERRLLRREAPSPEKSGMSIEIAESMLEEAEKSLGYDLTNSVIILSYTSMFHAARALLFRDGFTEKSHVCLIEYLREKYVKAGRMSEALVNALDSARAERHETLYGLETRIGKKDAEYSLEKAKEFLAMIKNMLSL